MHGWATSAGWIREIERPVSEEEAHPHHEAHEHHEEHEHHHEEEHNHAHAHEHSHEGCHHHHHEEGETEEYGISSFVYYRRPAFDIHKFDRFVATKWPRNVIRAKGVALALAATCRSCSNRPDDRNRFQKPDSGMPPSRKKKSWNVKREPGLLRDWDEHYSGAACAKIVFISTLTRNSSSRGRMPVWNEIRRGHKVMMPSRVHSFRDSEHHSFICPKPENLIPHSDP